MSAATLPPAAAKTAKHHRPLCACCRKTLAGDLQDAELGGPVCNTCAVAGALAVKLLAKAGIQKCTRRDADRDAKRGTDGRFL